MPYCNYQIEDEKAGLLKKLAKKRIAEKYALINIKPPKNISISAALDLAVDYFITNYE